jgi:tRNA pseudouridine55 synthase
LNGVLVIDKPKGWTSHDVVARVRRVLRLKKAGHGGTLDPLATGVLPVYLEEATKLVPFNLEGTKEYQATMKRGQETDTLDADGKIIAEKSGFICTLEMIEGILGKFRGPIRQVPPLFSALKHEGVPLYRRARGGERPRLAERGVRVYALSLEEFSSPLMTLQIICGRGTYVRSLCADIGRALGCGGHLVELRRLRSGRFTLDQAVNLEEFSRLFAEGRLGERILPLEDGVDLAEEIHLGEKTADKVRRGQPLHLMDLDPAGGDRERLRKGERVGLFQNPDGLLAIAESQVDGGLPLAGNPQVLRILRVFQGPWREKISGSK